jgi:hypothetical protein
MNENEAGLILAISYLVITLGYLLYRILRKYGNKSD